MDLTFWTKNRRKPKRSVSRRLISWRPGVSGESKNGDDERHTGGKVDIKLRKNDRETMAILIGYYLDVPLEVSKWLGSVGYNPNIPHLEVGEIAHLLTIY